jgi:hypothetical protein
MSLYRVAHSQTISVIAPVTKAKVFFEAVVR